MKELCQDDRPREKMLSKGKDSLSNAELLAILLRTGTGGQNAVETARSLLQLAGGSLSELSGLSVERMCGIAGIGSGKAATIAAALELGRRAGAEKSGISFMNGAGVVTWFSLILYRESAPAGHKT